MFLPPSVPCLSTTQRPKRACEIVYLWVTWTFVLLSNRNMFLAFFN